MNSAELLEELKVFYPQMNVLSFLDFVDNEQLDANEEGFEIATHLFIQREGKQKIQELILEIECIEANEDWSLFTRLILMLRGKSLAEESLQEMGEIIRGTYYAGAG